VVEHVAKRVLVTGCNGAIGIATSAELKRRGHVVVGLDLAQPMGVDEGFTGSVVDAEVVKRAVAGVDTVVHLAAEVDDCDFVSRLVPANVIGPYNVLQAAKDAGVKRVVLTSSVQVISGLSFRRERRVKVSDGCAPTNHYALAKVWQEEMGRMYARVHKLSVISVRVGWMIRNAKETAWALARPEHAMGIYLSRADAGRLFAACVESAYPGAGEELTVNGTSRPASERGMDGSDAVELLGYEPRDTFPEGLPGESDKR
jgi:uronate dehydrogenase